MAIIKDNKKYVLMKDGVAYKEAKSAKWLEAAEMSEVREYLNSNLGNTVVAENGEDWEFTFEPFSLPMIEALVDTRIEVRCSYSHGSRTVNWTPIVDGEYDRSKWTPDRSGALYRHRVPSVMEWHGNIGYGQYVFDDEYYLEPCAVIVTTTDLLRGRVRIPRLNLTMPGRLYYAGWTNRKAKLFMTITPDNMNIDDSAVIMESKNLLEWNLENEEFYSCPNVINRGGTLEAEPHEIGVAVQEYGPMYGLEVIIRWGRDIELGSFFNEASLLDLNSGESIEIDDVFQITIHKHPGQAGVGSNVRLISEKLGLDVNTKDLCQHDNDGTTWHSKIMALTEDVLDLQIIDSN